MKSKFQLLGGYSYDPWNNEADHFISAQWKFKTGKLEVLKNSNIFIPENSFFPPFLTKSFSYSNLLPQNHF
ncbi:hypothetical protein M1146_03960 [Patescibacteria group bacterium]|nr:hypothetical protein [Patescibacteria group bacterium]